MARMLVLGGTGFLGGAVVRAARDAGHDVVVMARRAGPGGLALDRHGDLSALRGQRFDTVVDTCAYFPDAVTHLLAHLDPAPDRYVMISSVSVYPDFSGPPQDEDADVPGAPDEMTAPYRAAPPQDRGRVPVTGENYGPLKRSCEIAAIDALGDRALILRPGLIVGPGDQSERFTWWVRRIDRGGRIPVPTDRAVQVIDARDIAGLILSALAAGAAGIVNAAGDPQSLHAMLAAIRDAAGSQAEFVVVDDERLAAAGVGPWMNLPLWLPAGPDHAWFFAVPNVRAHALGLQQRPIGVTAADTLVWDRTRRDHDMATGLTDAQERALLDDG